MSEDVLIATFNPTTGWAGKRISYANGQFTLESHGMLAPQHVLDYDEAGQIEWAYDGLREWVRGLRAAGDAASTPHAGIEAATHRDGRTLVYDETSRTFELGGVSVTLDEVWSLHRQKQLDWTRHDVGEVLRKAVKNGSPMGDLPVWKGPSVFDRLLEKADAMAPTAQTDAGRADDPSARGRKVKVETYKGDKAAQRGMEKMIAKGWTVQSQSSRKRVWRASTGLFTRQQIHTVTYVK